MTAFLSSKGIPHHILLSHVPLYHLLAANSSLYPGIALLSLRSSSQSLNILVNLSGVHRAIAQIVWFSFHWFMLHSLTASNASLLSKQIALMWGFHPCFSFSTPGCRSIQSHSLPLFPLLPLSYQLLHGSIYYFLEARDSCQLSGGIL